MGLWLGVDSNLRSNIIVIDFFYVYNELLSVGMELEDVVKYLKCVL